MFTKTERLDCPFCGWGGTKVSHTGPASVHVLCEACGASGESCANPEEAIEAWNCRTFQTDNETAAELMEFNPCKECAHVNNKSDSIIGYIISVVTGVAIFILFTLFPMHERPPLYDVIVDYLITETQATQYYMEADSVMSTEQPGSDIINLFMEEV